MQPEHYVPAKLASQSRSRSHGCLTLQSTIISFPWWLLFFFPFPPPPRWRIAVALDFLRSDLSMKWGGGGGGGGATQTRTLTHTQNENTMDNFEDFRGFQSSVVMTVTTSWLTSCRSACVGVNKAQCHGNHIKSTFKNRILLTKAMKLVFDICLRFALGVSVVASQFNLKEKITIGWDCLLYGLIHNQDKSRTQSNTFSMFMSMKCVQCVDGFIYSILYTPVTMYYCLHHSQGPQLWNAGRPEGVLPSVSTRWAPGPSRSGPFGVIWHCSFHFSVEREYFRVTSNLAKMTSETKCFGTSVTCATSTVILLLMPPPPHTHTH